MLLVQPLDNRTILEIIGCPLRRAWHEASRNHGSVQNLVGIHEGGKHMVAVPSIAEVVVTHLLHLRLRLHHVYNGWKLFRLRSSPDNRFQLVAFNLFRLHILYTGTNVLGKFVNRLPDSPVFLLLFPLLKILVCICNQHKILKLGEICIFSAFPSHINQSVLETSPVTSNSQKAHILQAVCPSISSL